jgi:transposase
MPALNTHTGEVLGSAVPRHTSDEFIAFLASLATSSRARARFTSSLTISRRIRLRGWTFLAADPSVRLHYTPTYSSWLNEVELWFSKIERDVIARGIFTSLTDLRRKLMRYIRHYKGPQTALVVLCGPREAHRMITVQVIRTVH